MSSFRLCIVCWCLFVRAILNASACCLNTARSAVLLDTNQKLSVFVCISSGLFLLIFISRHQLNEICSNTWFASSFIFTENLLKISPSTHTVDALHICCWLRPVFQFIACFHFNKWFPAFSRMRYTPKNLSQLQLLLQTIYNKFNEKPLKPQMEINWVHFTRRFLSHNSQQHLK